MKKSNVEVTKDFKTFVIFQSTCECGDSDHTLRVMVEDWGEKWNEPKNVMATFFFKCGRFETNIEDSFFKRMWYRIKDACKILFTGYLVLDEEFIFRDREHLKDFTNTLEEAVNQIEEYVKSKETEV